MKLQEKLHTAIMAVVKEVEIELRRSQNDKITRIAELWVQWNSKKIDSRDAMLKIESILKEETEFSWQEFIGRNEVEK